MAVNEDLIKKYNLSDREAEIAALILEGLDNGKIARKSFITVATVKTHVYNLFNKVGVRNRYELISLFQSGPKKDLEPKVFRQPKLVYLIIAGLGFLTLLTFFTAQFLINRPGPLKIHREVVGREKPVSFSKASLPGNIQSIPDGLDPLTVARWFYHIGSVQKNRELWQKLLTKDDWSKAKEDSVWHLLAEKGRSYYFVYIGENEPNYKKYFFQRQEKGKDLGNPGPIIVVREDGKWRVRLANP